MSDQNLRLGEREGVRVVREDPELLVFRLGEL
jgi:hypothetical protein